MISSLASAVNIHNLDTEETVPFKFILDKLDIYSETGKFNPEIETVVSLSSNSSNTQNKMFVVSDDKINALENGDQSKFKSIDSVYCSDWCVNGDLTRTMRECAKGNLLGIILKNFKHAEDKEKAQTNILKMFRIEHRFPIRIIISQTEYANDRSVYNF